MSFYRPVKRPKKGYTINMNRVCKIQNLLTSMPLAAVLLFSILSAPPLAAQQKTIFQQGEELFLQNNPSGAIPKLEAAIKQQPSNETAFMYLGIAYEQVGNLQKAADTYINGAQLGGNKAGTLYFNAGNALYALKQFTKAEQVYTNAVSSEDAPEGVWLNRAGVRVEQQKWEPALEDYGTYLTLQPQDPQKPQISRMMDILGSMIREAERVAEQERIKAEEERQRQQDLLNQVLNSLNKAKEDTTNMSAESEGIEFEDEELDLAD